MDIHFSNHYEFGLLQSPSTFIPGSCEVETNSDHKGCSIFEPSGESIGVQQSNSDLFGFGRKRSNAEFMPAGLINSTPNKRQKVKRSQKLTNKITALQKLVSPYGKTDTSSVLLEASISIQALQHQIQDLFHRLSQENLSQIGGRYDLQSRGLCLVPLSFSNYLMNEESTIKSYMLQQEYTRVD